MSTNDGLAAVAAAAAAADGAPAPKAETTQIKPESAAKPVNGDEAAAVTPAGPVVDPEALRREGAEAERARLMQLDALALPGCEAVIEAAKANGTTPEAAAVEMVNHLKQTGALDMAKHLQTSAETVPELPADPSDPVGTADAAEPAPVPETEAGWISEWEASADLQSEFTSAKAYAAFKKNEKDGRVKILGKGGR